jgi:hypothetical protein
MLPGPPYIYQCTNCRNLVFKRSLRSGNTIGAILYSDGKRIAPMSPEFPRITKCSKCKTIFWLTDNGEIGTYKDGKIVNGNGEIAEEAKFLSVYGYVSALKNKLYRKDSNDELYLREHICWAFNDRVRNNIKFLNGDNDKKIWVDNINELLALLDVNDEQHKIAAMEFYRYLGNFEKSKEILDSLNDADFGWLKESYLNEINNKNTMVFLLRGKEND